MNAYVVTMRRYGDREKHSYVLGVFSTKQSAIIAGGLEEMYRADKYKADIEKFKTVLHGNQDADYDKQLQIETLKAQLAEAENDADRLASRWVVLGQNCCSFCGKPVKWSMIIDAECPIADHAPDCPILHHQKRKEGK